MTQYQPPRSSVSFGEFNAVVDTDVTHEQLELERKGIENEARRAEIENKTRFQNTLLKEWKDHHAQNRELRKKFAIWILSALLFQVVVMCTAFFLIGFDVMSHIDQWVANTFIVSVFSEVAAMAIIVFKNLFPTEDRSFEKLLEHISPTGES